MSCHAAAVASAGSSAMTFSSSKPVSANCSPTVSARTCASRTREPDVVGCLAQLVHDLLLRAALLLDFAQLRIDLVGRLARFAEIGFDDQTVVELADQGLLLGRERLAGCIDLRLELLLAFREMRELTLHARERRARRLFRAAPRFHFDGDRLRGFAMLFRLRARFGHAILVIAPLPARNPRAPTQARGTARPPFRGARGSRRAPSPALAARRRDRRSRDRASPIGCALGRARRGRCRAPSSCLRGAVGGAWFPPARARGLPRAVRAARACR